MFEFIKKLFGLGPAEMAKIEEMTSVTIPQTRVADPVGITKVRAIGDSKPVAAAAPPTNKKRRPYRGNKVKANTSATKVDVPPTSGAESKTKGSNNSLKPSQVAKVKSQVPKMPANKPTAKK